MKKKRDKLLKRKLQTSKKNSIINLRRDNNKKKLNTAHLLMELE